MRNFDKSTAVDEELHNLKLRFELLEGDRKAYYETSQWAIRRNKDEINNYRIQNKMLSESLAKIKKRETEAQSRIMMTEVEKYDQKVRDIQKKYDELHAEGKQRELKLNKQRNLLGYIKREAEVVNSNAKDSQQAKDIRALENRLDKAVIKYNEAQSIRKTYELIVKRLQEERLNFDNQLSNLEKTIRAKKQDGAELEMMSRDANHAKEVAKVELAGFEQQINEDRKQREKDLSSRKEMVKAKLEANDKTPLLTKSDDRNTEANNGTEANVPLDEMSEKTLTEYEEIMRLIKETTGVTDISEVIGKFQAQGETHEQLSRMQKANEQKIAELKAKKAALQKDEEDLKFTGESKVVHSQRTIQEFEDLLLEEEEALARAKQQYERNYKVMLNANAGVKHITAKLDVLKPSDAGKVPVVNEGNVVEALGASIKKIETIATNLQSKELPEAQPKEINQLQQPGDAINILVVNSNVLPQHNTRVKMRPVVFEDLSAADDEDEDDEFGEVLDRETLKKRTAQLLNARLKSKQPKKQKKKRGGDPYDY